MNPRSHPGAQLEAPASFVSLEWIRSGRTREGPRARAIWPPTRSGGVRAAVDPTIRGAIAIARVDTGTSRRRAAVDRHHAIAGAAREACRRLGCRTERFVLTRDDLSRLAELARHRGCLGMLILSGLDEEVLRHFSASLFPCVYADVAGEAMAARAVAPDYGQSVRLAMDRLLAAGFHRPGLILDRDLSLLAREDLIEAYGSGFSTAGIPAPPPFLTPTRPFDLFDIWLGRHGFDSLLTTDLECTRRLAPENKHPILELDLNLQSVGRRAVAMLQGQVSMRHGAQA